MHRQRENPVHRSTISENSNWWNFPSILSQIARIQVPGKDGSIDDSRIDTVFSLLHFIYAYNILILWMFFSMIAAVFYSKWSPIYVQKKSQNTNYR